MLRKFLAAILFTAVAITPTYAQINEKRYADLTKINCEDAQTIADMEEIWGSMVSQTSGASSTKTQGYITIHRSKTVNKTPRQLRCSVHVGYSGKTGADARQWGYFTLNIAADGIWGVTFRPR